MDKLVLIELGRMMHAESPRYRNLPYDERQLSQVIDNLLQNPDAQILVASDGGVPVGMLAGIIVPHFFGPALYATDLVFYVMPEYRGTSAAPRLLREWERTLEADGRVGEISLGISTEVHPGRTKKLYKRFGFRESGAIMVKELATAKRRRNRNV